MLETEKSLSESTSLSSTASCLSSALLTNQEWYNTDNTSNKQYTYDDHVTDVYNTSLEIVSEDINTCGINLLNSTDVETTLAQLEDTSAEESDWTDDGTEQTLYHTMNAVAFDYDADICTEDSPHISNPVLTEYTPTCLNGTIQGQQRRRHSSVHWSDSEDSFEVEIDRSRMPVHIRTLNLSEEEDSGDSISDDNQSMPKVSRVQNHRKSDLTHCKNSRSRRGRPPTFHKSGYRQLENTRGKHNRSRVPKDILLWKFILDELRKPECTHIQWENESLGTFKFVDTVECSRRWGQMKNTNTMTFEKLSRSIRYYYKDGLMRRNGLRLVYKINWDKVPEEYCPR
ncbi:sequence-specific DNA binding [Mactra antiquata]